MIEGVAGEWRVDPAVLGQPFQGRHRRCCRPFDRLVHDRVRLADLFEYEYVLEMYKPKASRRWGYFALPILHGDGWSERWTLRPKATARHAHRAPPSTRTCPSPPR